MEKNKGVKRCGSSKITSLQIGQWIVRPLVGIIERESLKLERLIEAVRLESYEHGEFARDKILHSIDELEKSIEIMAREMAKKEGESMIDLDRQ